MPCCCASGCVAEETYFDGGSSTFTALELIDFKKKDWTKDRFFAVPSLLLSELTNNIMTFQH